MPKWCSVGVCNNHHLITDENGNQRFCFFRFPLHEKDPQPERRAKWAQACGRFMTRGSKQLWYPPDHVVGVYVCSEHFITGEPVNRKDHPDYIPSVDLNLHLVGQQNPNSLQKDEQKIRR